ncbi:MAG: LPXTG cell wall anchor domain-containing protein [Eubacteriales bacterium]|nr:LPXTG cell wall anchor domain-containing protein [Eubacteriales bacterium]
MKKKMSRMMSCFFMLLLLCTAPVQALAADANVTYSGNAGEFIFAPGSKYSPTDLFPNFKDVMPGDVLRQKIEVKNNANKKVKVKIYLRIRGANDEASNEFLKELHLTVKKAEDTPLFDAAANESAGLNNWMLLGTLYSGGKTQLDVTLTVPTSLDNIYQQKLGAVQWQFMVEELPVENTDPQPQTGDETNLGLWIGIAAVCAAGLVIWLVLWKKRNKDDETEKRG